MINKRINKVIIFGFTKYPGFNDGYGIYKYTENGFLSSFSKFCNSTEKPWCVEKYINNDCGLPIKVEYYLMGKYVRYDTCEYSDDNILKRSVNDLVFGFINYIEFRYENGKKVESRLYSKNGELGQYRYVEYDHLGRKSKITRKSLDGVIETATVYEYDNDKLLARIDYLPDEQIIKNQYSWEEKDCSANLLNWFIL